MKQITKLGVLSVAKIQAVIMAVIGLLVGIFYALLGFFVGMMAEEGMMELGWSIIIILPILYAVLGFVGGAIGAAVYNLAAKYIGGLEIELS